MRSNYSSWPTSSDGHRPGRDAPHGHGQDREAGTGLGTLDRAGLELILHWWAAWDRGCWERLWPGWERIPVRLVRAVRARPADARRELGEHFEDCVSAPNIGLETKRCGERQALLGEATGPFVIARRAAYDQ